jgi:hypothetical protein
MSLLSKVVSAIVAALLVVVLLVGLSASSNNGAPQAAAEDAGQLTPAEPRADPAPPPPVRAKGPGAGPAGKPISLVDAILIAEKVGKGQATKAERKDRPELSFKIDVLGLDGSKSKVELTGDGKVKDRKEDEPK